MQVDIRQMARGANCSHSITIVLNPISRRMQMRNMTESGEEVSDFKGGETFSSSLTFAHEITGELNGEFQK